MNSVKLNQNNLGKIAHVVTAPSYNRADMRPAIVHLGLGHFHRAHQAFFLDKLLSAGITTAGIFEINLVADTYPIAEIAREQDYLYTLLSKGKDGKEDARVIGAILGYHNGAVAGGAEEAIARLASAGLVSLTITEKGYCYDDTSGGVDWKHPAIAHDRCESSAPQSAIGFLAAALERRSRTDGGSRANRQPLTIMSCDNFPSNGQTLKACVLSFCREVYPAILSWIEDNVVFPNSMVDRITPNTTPATLSCIEEKYGIRDTWAVSCEDFIQWVLEDNFKLPVGAVFNPRDFGKVGVQIVKDVEPYELMKIRLLNGSHSALSYPAHLMGYTGVAEAIEDPLLAAFIRQYYMEEITATLPLVEGIDLAVYKDTLISRFSNRNIADTILRLASDGSKKIPNAILRPLAHTLRNGQPHQAIVLSLAAWARFLAGTDEAGKSIPLEDPNAVPLVIPAAKQARHDPAAFLRAIGISGADVALLVPVFADFLERVYTRGTRKTLTEFLGATG